MSFLHWLADEKIKAAIKDGEFEHLQGLGKPLDLDDLSHIPEELRAGYRILKNAGIVPEEVQLNKDIATLGSLLAMCRDDVERTGLQKELSAKRLRLQSLTGSRGWDHLQAYADYKDKIQARLEGEDRLER
jgi:hypothetical protein